MSTPEDYEERRLAALQLRPRRAIALADRRRAERLAGAFSVEELVEQRSSGEITDEEFEKAAGIRIQLEERHA